MTKRENESKQNLEAEEIMNEAENVVEELTDENGEIDEVQVEISKEEGSPQLTQLKEALAKSQADYENFKKRTARDKEDMVFFLKSKIILPILKRVDDLERMIKNTPEEQATGSLYDGILAVEKALKKDLWDLWVQAFISVGNEVDPHKHDVMTQVPGQAEWIIFDEFEKGYELDGKVLRVAKVVVGAG